MIPRPIGRAAVAAVLLAGLAATSLRSGPTTPPAAVGTAVATFAGGCFWCMEPPFDRVAGVLSTTSGYTGGQVPRPSYEQVSAGGTGHLEAIEVVYDPKRVTFAALLDVFWHNIDPTDGGGQFCDHGTQYRSAIFVRGEAEEKLAQESKRAIAARLGRAVATEVRPAVAFYPAEDYHQDYYKKNPIRYKFYRTSCGRDARLREIWGEIWGKSE
jgi:peptide-methionine (S)-S-oxide reductase